MSEASFASLNPALLARKGGAKPAMRPQLTNLPDAAATADALEDLGWNDMGSDDEDTDEKPSADVVQLTPARPDDVVEEEIVEEGDEETQSRASEEPAVLLQQQQIADSIASTPIKSGKKASRRKPAQDQGRRAAFTLRLDTHRHLKLRLAATMQGKSAQAVVTEALDAMLDQIDELDSLADKMKRD